LIAVFGKFRPISEYCVDRYNGILLAYSGAIVQKQLFSSILIKFAEILSILCLVGTALALFRKESFKQLHIILLQLLIISLIIEIVYHMALGIESKIPIAMIRENFVVLSCCLLALMWYTISIQHVKFEFAHLFFFDFIAIYFLLFLLLRMKYDVNKIDEDGTVIENLGKPVCSFFEANINSDHFAFRFEISYVHFCIICVHHHIESLLLFGSGSAY
jgi:hypothetical protein